MSPQKKNLHILMLADAWFPSDLDGPGEFSGMQVHIREIRKHLRDNHRSQVELFFPANPNLLIRWSWSIIVMFQVYNYSRSHPVDIIHSHGNISAIPAKCLSIFLGKPLIHTVHRFSELDLNKKNLKALLQWVVLTKIPYTAQITISRSFLKEKNLNRNIIFIPNGVSVSAFNAIKVDKAKQPTLIWVGRDDPSKGLEYLRKAIKKVRQSIPELQAELVTGGRLTGGELIKAYKRSHLFVLPSLTETLPMSLLEAWAAKLPVVVTAVGDIPEMVTDGINGYLIEPGNVKQLNQAILKALRAKVTNIRMGEAGYEYVKKHYSWKEVANQTHKVYLHILK